MTETKTKPSETMDNTSVRGKISSAIDELTREKQQKKQTALFEDVKESSEKNNTILKVLQNTNIANFKQVLSLTSTIDKKVDVIKNLITKNNVNNEYLAAYSQDENYDEYDSKFIEKFIERQKIEILEPIMLRFDDLMFQTREQIEQVTFKNRYKVEEKKEDKPLTPAQEKEGIFSKMFSGLGKAVSAIGAGLMFLAMPSVSAMIRSLYIAGFETIGLLFDPKVSLVDRFKNFTAKFLTQFINLAFITFIPFLTNLLNAGFRYIMIDKLKMSPNNPFLKWLDRFNTFVQQVGKLTHTFVGDFFDWLIIGGEGSGQKVLDSFDKLLTKIMGGLFGEDNYNKIIKPFFVSVKEHIEPIMKWLYSFVTGGEEWVKFSFWIEKKVWPKIDSVISSIKEFFTPAYNWLKSFLTGGDKWLEFKSWWTTTAWPNIEKFYNLALDYVTPFFEWVKDFFKGGEAFENTKDFFKFLIEEGPRLLMDYMDLSWKRALVEIKKLLLKAIPSLKVAISETSLDRDSAKSNLDFELINAKYFGKYKSEVEFNDQKKKIENAHKEFVRTSNMQRKDMNLDQGLEDYYEVLMKKSINVVFGREYQTPQEKRQLEFAKEIIADKEKQSKTKNEILSVVDQNRKKYEQEKKEREEQRKKQEEKQKEEKEKLDQEAKKQKEEYDLGLEKRISALQQTSEGNIGVTVKSTEVLSKQIDLGIDRLLNEVKKPVNYRTTDPRLNFSSI